MRKRSKQRASSRETELKLNRPKEQRPKEQRPKEQRPKEQTEGTETEGTESQGAEQTDEDTIVQVTLIMKMSKRVLVVSTQGIVEVIASEAVLHVAVDVVVSVIGQRCPFNKSLTKGYTRDRKYNRTERHFCELPKNVFQCTRIDTRMQRSQLMLGTIVITISITFSISWTFEQVWQQTITQKYLI